MPESLEQMFGRESVSSILGLLITIWILFNLNGIRKDFLFKARIPHLIQKLEKHSSLLSTYLQDFVGSKQMINLELGKCRANLKSLRSKLPRSSRGSVKKLESQIQTNTPISSKEKTWAIYTELNSLIEAMKNLEQDKQWERSL